MGSWVWEGAAPHPRAQVAVYERRQPYRSQSCDSPSLETARSILIIIFFLKTDEVCWAIIGRIILLSIFLKFFIMLMSFPIFA